MQWQRQKHDPELQLSSCPDLIGGIPLPCPVLPLPTPRQSGPPSTCCN